MLGWNGDFAHLLDLINDILDLSKVEAGRLRIQREAVDIAASVEEALASIRPGAAAKSIRIETGIAVSDAIFADRVRFKQILYNLLSNAVKFTPAGGNVSVALTCREQFAEISVRDNGTGIQTEDQPFVFETFYQGSSASVGVSEGTGLGLPVTKALVEQHGGRIWFESEPGKGSCFTFSLRMASSA
jgi:signal transduction histidine kinase